MQVNAGHGAKLIPFLFFRGMLLWFFLSLNVPISAQVQWFLDGKPWDPGLSDPTPQAIDSLISSFQTRGYVFAGVDSVRDRSYYIHKGKRYRWRSSDGRKIDQELDNWLNQGYPFARIQRDSIELRNGKLIYSTRVTSGPRVSNDSLILLNDVPVKITYLQKLLSLEPAEWYSEDDFRSISDRMRRVPFLRLASAANTSFQNEKAWYYLDLTYERTNRFEGILGLLPNQSTSGGTVLTGSIDLELDNLFRSGKQLDIHWQRFAVSSQQLDLHYFHPFIFSSAVNLDLEFALTRQDSSFFSTRTRMGGQFYLSDLWALEASYERTNHEVLTSDSLTILANNWQEFSRDLYGLSGLYNWQSDLNRREQGWRAKLSIGVGGKEIRENPLLPETVYDSIALTSTSVQAGLQGSAQWLIGNVSSLFVRSEGHYLAQPNVLRNELFRPGGVRSLRGFNEQFFYTSFYAMHQVEYRLFFEDRSFVFLFYDQGYLIRPQVDQPSGFGLGLQLETKPGLFTFVLAGGRSNEQPLDANNMKVHFGYAAQF